MKNADVKFDSSQDHPNEVTITFSGRLTINNSPGFHEILIEKLEEFDTFNIATTEVEAIDLSFYQLMMSLQKTLVEMEKKYTFNLSLPADDEELLSQAGFDTELL